MRYLVFILLLFVGVCGYAQQYANPEYYLVDSLDLNQLTETDRLLVDSCLKMYHKAEHDTDKVNALNGICENMYHEDWIKYQFYQYELINQTLATSPPAQITLALKKSLAGALNNIGYIYHNQGDIPKALEYFHKSLSIQEALGDKQGMALSYNNIGIIYRNQGDIPNALEYYHNSLSIQEALGDKQGMALSYNNIGYIYSNQGDIPKALEYYHKSLSIREAIGDKKGMADSYNNIGYIYDDQGDPSITSSKEESLRAGQAKALEYYHKSLSIQEVLGDKQGMATSYNNIGLIYSNQGDIPNALEYYHNSLSIYEELGDKQGMANSYNNIGGIKLGQGTLAEAKQMGTKGLQLAQELGFPDVISENSKLLSQVAKQQGNYKEALEMYELHITNRDSIKNEETQKATIRQQTKYEFEKAQLVKEQEEKEAARLLAEQTSRRNNLQYSLIFLGILLFFGVVLSLGFIKVSPTLAEGLIFFAFLILFEFLLVVADPYVNEYTGGEPIYNLLANAVLAGAIFPAHAFFESVLKKRLIDIKRKQ